MHRGALSSDLAASCQVLTTELWFTLRLLTSARLYFVAEDRGNGYTHIVVMTSVDNDDHYDTVIAYVKLINLKLYLCR